MPRLSKLLRWEAFDDRFRVAVFARNDSPTFRVMSGFRGDRPTPQPAGDEEEGRAIGEAIWLAYQRGEIETPAVAPGTLAELVDLLCERPEHSAATRRSYRAVWAPFVAQLGTRHPSRIYPLDVRSYLATVTGATRDTYLRTLRACLRYAVTQGWIVEDPTAGLKAEHKHVMGPWLPTPEWPAFLAACSPSHRIRCGFVLETGLRAGELAAARWDWIHGQVGMRALRIHPDPRGPGFVPKWGMARAVPLSREALRWLDEARAKWGGAGEDHIFSKGGLSALGNLSDETRQAVARAECTTTDFHGLRRSAGAMWLESGASMYEVMRLLGHQDLQTTVRWYAGVTDRHLSETMGRIDEARDARAKVPSIRSANRSARSRDRG